MYRVIRSTDLQFLEERINSALASGAKLAGGIFAIEVQPKIVLWCQAVMYP